MNRNGLTLFTLIILWCVSREIYAQSEKVNMREQLKEISETSISLGDKVYTDQIISIKWLVRKPATGKQILNVEKKLGMTLPNDYKEFLKISNGFEAPNTVEPTFLSVEEINYLDKLDPGLIKIWTETGNDEVGLMLKRSIIVAGLGEEQYFLLIPGDNKSSWRYWKFAAWIPGEVEYKSLPDYFACVLEFNRENLKEEK